MDGNSRMLFLFPDRGEGEYQCRIWTVDTNRETSTEGTQ